MPDAEPTRAPLLQALIVDDEPPARSLIQEYLADSTLPIEVCGTCGTGTEAVDRINNTLPDLVFLDVQMPGLSGFEVLERLDVVPHIIFSTAYDEYAIRAFDAGAVDYLLKPYSRARFQKAVERAVERHEARRKAHHGGDDDAYARRLADLLHAAQDADPAAPLTRLYVQRGDVIVPVETSDILWIEAAGDYTHLHTANETYLSNTGIGALEKRLDADRFKRVHRSSIIALSALRHLRSDGSGGYIATLTDSTRVRVSRSYAAQIRDLMA